MLGLYTLYTHENNQQHPANTFYRGVTRWTYSLCLHTGKYKFIINISILPFYICDMVPANSHLAKWAMLHIHELCSKSPTHPI
jgi:hypothetical protein